MRTPYTGISQYHCLWTGMIPRSRDDTAEQGCIYIFIISGHTVDKFVSQAKV